MTIILIGFLNYVSVIGQTYSSVTSDKEIYDFLNWLTDNENKHNEEPKLKRKRISNRIISWSMSGVISQDSLRDFYLPYSIRRQYVYGADTIFNEQDVEFLYKQVAAIKRGIWQDRFSKSKLLTKKIKKTNYYNYSIPLFSADKKYVIIFLSYYCGNLCFNCGCYVYQHLDNNKWEYITAIYNWNEIDTNHILQKAKEKGGS